MKSLGIDLGSNSLGWAILDEDSIKDCGVVIFDEGIIRNKGVDSLKTPAAQRRKYRMARRLKFRRRLRKLHVLDVLVRNGMCPLLPKELREMKNQGKFPRNEEFVEWLKSTSCAGDLTHNPYYARAQAAKEKIDPLLLGRALYHLAQRRGFKSSRKDLSNTDDTNDPANKELGKVKQEIAGLTKKLEASNYTLGQYFYQLFLNGDKIRQQHTSRVEHYQKEFEKIAEVQNLSQELAQELRHALFFQRPLRSQKHLVGKCQLEKQHSRCLISHPLFELYRMYAFINTIKVDEGKGMRALTAEERAVAEKVFFRKERSFEFEKIIKALYPSYRKKENFSVTFNYHPDRDIPSCRTVHQFNGLLGQDFLSWKYQRISNDKVTVLL